MKKLIIIFITRVLVWAGLIIFTAFTLQETTYFQKLLYPFGAGSIISILLSIISMNMFKMLERNGNE